MSRTTASSRYQARVVQYLLSPLGRDTPDSIASKLMALTPASIDMPDEPSLPYLHCVRAYLFAWEAENDQYARDQASGIHMVELQAVRS